MDTFFRILYWIALFFTALSAGFWGEETYQKDAQLQNRYGLEPPFSAWHIWMWVGLILMFSSWGLEEDGLVSRPVGTIHLVALIMIIIGRIVEVYIRNHWKLIEPQKKRHRLLPFSPSGWFIWMWTGLIFLFLFREKAPWMLLGILVIVGYIILVAYWRRTHPSQYDTDLNSYDYRFSLPSSVWSIRLVVVYMIVVLLLLFLLPFLEAFFPHFVGLAWLGFVFLFVAPFLYAFFAFLRSLFH